MRGLRLGRIVDSRDQPWLQARDTSREYLFSAWMRCWHSNGNSLLQPHLGSLNSGIGMKAILHSTIVKGVVEGNQTHALVVGHESSNQNAFLTLWQALRRIVYRLVKAVGCECSLYLYSS